MIYSHSMQMGTDSDDDMSLEMEEAIIPINIVHFGDTTMGASWVVDESDEANKDYYFDMKEVHGAPTAYRVIANLPFEVYSIFPQSNFAKIKFVLDARCGKKTKEVYFQAPTSEMQEVTMSLDPGNFTNVMFDEIFTVSLPATMRFYASKYTADGGVRLLGGKMNCFIYSIMQEEG